MGRASTNADRFSVHFSISARKAVINQNGKTIILKTNLISSTRLSFTPIIKVSTIALQGCQPLCSPAALQLRGKILEFCQFGKDLSANVDQLIQPLPQVLHVGCVDFAALIGTFGVLVQIVAAHLQKIRHAPQLRQVKIQAVAIQSHFSDIGAQAADAHAQHLFINAAFLSFCGSQDNDFIPLFLHRASPSLS